VAYKSVSTPSRRDDLNANRTAVTVPTMKAVAPASNNPAGKFANSETAPAATSTSTHKLPAAPARVAGAS